MILLTDEEIDRLGEGILSLKYHSGSLEWQSYRKIRKAQLKKVVEWLKAGSMDAHTIVFQVSEKEWQTLLKEVKKCL